MTDQSAAMRKAMMLDAEWHRADAQFNAACEVHEAHETIQNNRAQWMKDYHARPGRREQRNERRQIQRRAARAAEKVT